MRCGQHPNRKATGACRACAGEFCEDCLVFSFGRMKAPYCVECALRASGVQPRNAVTAHEAE